MIIQIFKYISAGLIGFAGTMLISSIPYQTSSDKINNYMHFFSGDKELEMTSPDTLLKVIISVIICVMLIKEAFSINIYSNKFMYFISLAAGAFIYFLKLAVPIVREFINNKKNKNM